MKSPISYIGGKSILAKTIIEMMPQHESYCEVFAGAAWVLFRKEPSKFETINDLDSDLITFYRVLQNHLEEFLKQFKWVLTSREWFEDWKRQQDAGGLTDIQRAVRYYYLQRHCFSGRPYNRNFTYGALRRPGINLLRIEEELSEVHLRLAKIKIENLPWEKFITLYDRSETFFYLDPLYWKKILYKYNMKPEDYIKMAGILKEVKGQFILSINDLPEIRDIFKYFKIKPISFRYSAAKKIKSIGDELLISNF